MPVSISVGQILEVKLVAVWNAGMTFNNIFHYEVTNLGTGLEAPATVDEFLEGFTNDIVPLILPLNTPKTSYQAVQGNVRDKDTFNLINGETMFYAPAKPGTKVGAASPPFVCYTFKFLRETTAFRHGFKRIGDVPVDNVDTGVVTNPTVLGQLNTLALALSIDLTARHRVDETTTELISGAAAKVVVPQRFREHTALEPVLYSNINTVVFDRIGTQNSRKIGVGV